MPLQYGKKHIGDNIKELTATGKYAHAQVLAIALSKARGKKKR